MASFKSNVSYDTLISLRGKLTCLNIVITPEAVIRLEDELGRIFTVAKMHHYKQGQNMDTSPVPSPSQSTGLSSETRHGSTPYLPTQVHTPRQRLQLEMQPHYKSSMWQSIRS
jgi:hypothetical protein